MELSSQEILDLSEITDDPVLPLSEVAALSKTNTDAYPTGFKTIDQALGGGFQDGNLIIVSGISGEGKTSLMETLTNNFIRQGMACLWFSYEIPIKVLNWRFLRMGLVNGYEAYAPKIHTTGKLYWVKHKIKESWLKYATKVVFIDMLDFLAPSEINNKDNETLVLKKIAMELKTIAIELDVVIVVSTHITKLKEGEEPGMQNIAWSSGIYQNADFVIMINRERKTTSKKLFRSEPVTELCTEFSFIKIVKNRATGELKRIKCVYNNFKFTQIDYEHQADSPTPERGPQFGYAD